ncbi:ribonuclease G [Novimethylophilus kurashikiensis]|uniref:Ribonuclease G n=1 Tax=Novimethylophilus kurashikiensis TaxID=1825523 RepID=A0A2R5F946_9PROT|nr:TadE family protein [Novimethylophilus kurashikiensis]GBG13154.1 ribonuclease G [Novimethylophilus kurashikiensis]
MRHLNHHARLVHPHRGGALIEFGLVVILLVMIVGAIVEFGRVFWYYDALTKATRDSARMISLAPKETIASTASGDAQDLAILAAANAGVTPQLTRANVVVDCLNAAFQIENCVDGSAPANVRVSIVDFQVTIGGWIPLLLSTGAATDWEPTLAPHTTMRYMP